MELLFLGTSAGQPSKARNVSSTALKLLDERNEVWLFDCGEGTQRQILSTTLKPRKVAKLFITHMHGDHLFGLPGFLASRNFQASDEDGQTELDIFGPIGIKDFVMNSLKLTKTHLAFRINFHELSEAGKIFEDETFEVYTEKLDHTIFCLGYRIVEKNRVGELNSDRLKADGLPFGPLFGKIKKGETVEFEGKTFRPEDYIGDEKIGKVVTILGDTRKTDRSVHLAIGSDVLVHEATYKAGDEKMAKNHGHSSSRQAAEVANEAKVKRLLMNHVSARYMGADISELAQGAKSIFENSFVAKDFYEEKI
ncbi:ribonuclease Z [Lactovum miscens]|uniref:Ribonuclease Z n=1 Tax=Lactovum miscens TaxID=190387 RepID=A0A841C8N5_9LACT|nr:ribonuclease Z [Lactovum miscens]MBB5888088.1 ribonuclease Z [Lactovum miscens]